MDHAMSFPGCIQMTPEEGDLSVLISSLVRSLSLCFRLVEREELSALALIRMKT